MLGIYNFISTRVLGRDPSTSSSSQSPTFHLFSSLPAELRRTIWLLSLPERTIEASLDLQNGQWVCFYAKPKLPNSDHRCNPVLFAVNSESRQFCLDQYIFLANSYIHPQLDLLYITWYRPVNPPNAEEPPRFHPILGNPLSRFNSVAMTSDRNQNMHGRFAMLTTCLRNLGSPDELLLCMRGQTSDPQMHSKRSGFSLSTGGVVWLLELPAQFNVDDPKVLEDSSKQLRDAVREALQNEKASSTEFKIPKINKMLWYMATEASTL